MHKTIKFKLVNYGLLAIKYKKKSNSEWHLSLRGTVLNVSSFVSTDSNVDASSFTAAPVSVDAADLWTYSVTR